MHNEQDSKSPDNTPDKVFGETYVVEPTSPHKYTAILLHGRGNTGAEFAQQLFDSDPDPESENRESCHQAELDHPQLTSRLPCWRWVFPTAKTVWSTRFEEEMTTWFDDGASGDDAERDQRQVRDLMDAIVHVREVIDHEVARLGGDAGRVVLGGISQGGATALWTLLGLNSGLGRGEEGRGISGVGRLGGFVGMSMWLPFASEIEGVISPGMLRDAPERYEGRNGSVQHRSKRIGNMSGLQFVTNMLDTSEFLSRQNSASPEPSSFASTPTFLGHGSDDAYVDVELGRQASRVVSQLGFTVEWKEYVGAEQEGHWIKVPEEVDDVVKFLRKNVEAKGEGLEDVGVEDAHMKTFKT